MKGNKSKDLGTPYYRTRFRRGSSSANDNLSLENARKYLLNIHKNKL